jgi:hypothetical protein
MEGGREWACTWTRAGLEPSVGEEADGEDGESQEEDEEEGLAPAPRRAAALREPREAKNSPDGGPVREAKNSPEGGPVRGSGGSGRSSGEPGRRWVDAGGGGVAEEARVPR